ncbi:hypothetical protein VPH35_135535 [Triticum aestivum]
MLAWCVLLPCFVSLHSKMGLRFLAVADSKLVILVRRRSTRRMKRPSLHSCPRKPPPNDRLVISSSRRSERRTPLSQHAFSVININYARIRGRRGAGLLHVSGECLPWIQQEGDPAFFMSRATRVIDADYHSPVGVVLFNH